MSKNIPDGSLVLLSDFLEFAKKTQNTTIMYFASFLADFN